MRRVIHMNAWCDTYVTLGHARSRTFIQRYVTEISVIRVGWRPTPHHPERTVAKV